MTFISVTTTTAEALYEAVFEYCQSVKLDLKNLLIIGTDGASNMCGNINSLYTHLKTKLNLDNLVLMKCVCHSLNLCASKASEGFADDIDYLLKETYSWFRCSALRLSQYRQIYDLINTEASKFSKLVQLSSTRWLSRYRAVDKILNQYLELESFFQISSVNERCHAAKLLYEAYKNKSNKVILTFLRPVLKQIYLLNLYFQKKSVDYYQALMEINGVIWSIARQILKPAIVNHLENNLELLQNSLRFENNYLSLSDSDLGYDFQKIISEVNLTVEQVTDIKNRCVQFLKVLLQELVKRMPSHLKVFQQAQYFSPKLVLNPIRAKFSELPLQYLKECKISEKEIQYRNLLNIDWATVFENQIPEDSTKFWQKVMNTKNATGELMFRDIAIFAFTLFSLPTSNAVVERSFSIMNLVKCKIRNKIKLGTTFKFNYVN